MGLSKDDEIAILKAENDDLRQKLDKAYQSLMSWRHAVDVLASELRELRTHEGNPKGTPPSPSG